MNLELFLLLFSYFLLFLTIYLTWYWTDKEAKKEYFHKYLDIIAKLYSLTLKTKRKEVDKILIKECLGIDENGNVVFLIG
jgi:hypothetical protein